jgi:hypothetical protein
MTDPAPSDDDLLIDLLLEWEERVARGQVVSAADLYLPDRPDLVPALTEQIARLKRIALLSVPLPPESRTDVPHPPAEPLAGRYRLEDVIGEGGLPNRIDGRSPCVGGGPHSNQPNPSAQGSGSIEWANFARAVRALRVNWLGCVDPVPMLECIRPWASDRKLRLFAVACCRRIADELDTGLWPSMLDLAERYADGLATDEERRAIWTKVRHAAQGWASSEKQIAPNWVVRAAAAVYYATARDTWRAASKVGQEVVEALVWPDDDLEGYTVAEARTVELARQSALVRDIFVDPGRPVRFDDRWQTADVVGVAQGIYHDRAFDRLSILADALMDAGCDHEDVLSHCRNGRLHARGCWVVDLVLGKK